MGVYLDKLRSTLNDVQSKHITNLLHKQKNSGEISNLEQFRTRLSELTDQILSDKVSPSLEVIFGNLNQVIDSTTYNFMLDRIKDDLESIYSEVNTLDEISAAHSNIINNVVLKAIKFGVSELENKISLYEFLANNQDGFSKSLFNTFSAAQDNRTFRTDSDVGILFQDPRSRELIESDVTIDTLGEKIVLGADFLSYVSVKNISQIFDNEATQSEDIVAFADANINNVIDGAKGTYWTYSILQKQINPTGVTAKFELDLGANTDINFIEIESASIYPMNLIRIEYLDSNGISSNINIFEKLLNRTNRISFAKINAKKIKIVVQQLNALEVQYENKIISDNWDSIMSKNNPELSVDSISDEIHKSITSSKLLETAFMLEPSVIPGVQKKYFDYIIGFDNIRIGYSEYAIESIFVSSSVQIQNLQQIGLKAKELRPLEFGGAINFTEDTYPVGDVGYFHSSIEYNAILQNFNDKNQLVDINIISLLPTGVTYINHERLFLSSKVGITDIPNVGVLRFYVSHFMPEQKADIKVYSNGTLIVIDTDWIIEAYPFTNDNIPPNGLPNTMGIRILRPNLNDFYTVSYMPLLSNTRANPINLDNINIEFDTGTYMPTGIKIIDLIGDASATIDKNNIINISSQKHNGQTIAYTKLNLTVILRRNSINNHLSSAVDEYTLLMHNGE
jgi:hypothetical protein